MAFLEIEGVHKSFGTNQVLRGVDLHVDEHDVVCLIGPSGCGKSTLLRCINALEDIDEGAIRVDGEQASGRGVDLDGLRQEVGIVFQSFNLFPHMTVLENVTIAPRKVLGLPRNWAAQQALTLLARIGLDTKADEYPDRLAGGQQQRVAIARALAMQPRLLLLDEITSALDPELVSEVLNIVREFAAEGMTMMLATTRWESPVTSPQRCASSTRGSSAKRGRERIFSEPQHERTRIFLKRIIEAGRL